MKRIIGVWLAVWVLSSCVQQVDESGVGKINVVSTTTIITDLIENIGRDKVSVSGLMGPGVDPHLYKASEGDVAKLAGADLVFYGGLHLEGKLVDVFDKMKERSKGKRRMIDLGASLDKSKLRSSENFGGNYDPHVWFDVSLFQEEAKEVCRALAGYDPTNEAYFEANLKRYLEELGELDDYIKELASSLPVEKRILVTAHDAFSYFGDAYGFQVVGLQGISTATEAGVQNVRNTADFIVENKVSAIFIESSVPRRTIEALQQAVLSRNHDVEIGGMLYSDALGNPNTPEGTYIGMFRHNIETIVHGLKQ